MGKKVRVESNMKLAKPHAEGAVVELVQPVIHELGMIHVGHPYYWSCFSALINITKKDFTHFRDILSK